MSRLRFILVLAVLVTLLPLQSAVARAEAPARPDWDLVTTGGHFYSQTGDGESSGFVVSNQDGINFWDIFRRFTPKTLGYPITQRFEWNGRVTQVFQRGALQYDRINERVEVVNIFDALAQLDADRWLEANYRIPRMEPDNRLPGGDSFEALMAARLALLDVEPRLADFYYRLPDPVYLLGLPTSHVVDTGDVLSIRLQRGVLQLWTSDVPWARAGEVTMVMGGSIGVQAGLFPDGEQWRAVAAPEPAPLLPPFDESERIDPATVEVPDWGTRWVDVNLSTQRVYAMVDDYPIFWAPVTTGRQGMSTPVGRHRIFSRVFNETMDSTTLGIPRNGPGGWYLPNVYFTQYFFSGGYALHSNYWANPAVFGHTPSSAGCVGMFVKDAEFFWNFASIGTEVYVHY